jgi:hypothetical protein
MPTTTCDVATWLGMSAATAMADDATSGFQLNIAISPYEPLLSHYFSDDTQRIRVVPFDTFESIFRAQYPVFNLPQV